MNKPACLLDILSCLSPPPRDSDRWSRRGGPKPPCRVSLGEAPVIDNTWGPLCGKQGRDGGQDFLCRNERLYAGEGLDGRGLWPGEAERSALCGAGMGEHASLVVVMKMLIRLNRRQRRTPAIARQPVDRHTTRVAGDAGEDEERHVRCSGALAGTGTHAG